MAVQIHARTHLPGGTDPVPFQLPYMYGYASTSSVTVDTAKEVQFATVLTNDPDTFRFDNTDAGGLLIRRSGVYQLFATVTVNSSDTSVQKDIQGTIQLLSLGVLGGLGAPFGDVGGTAFSMGIGAGEASLAEVPSSPTNLKSVLTYQAWGPLLVSNPLTNPARAALILNHPGGDWDTPGTGGHNFLGLMRIGDYPQAAIAP